MARLRLDNPANYINRDLSWLAFNERVLEEAEDESVPLLERVRFLAISASNLDEFFEMRVAGLLQQIEDGHIEPGPDGLEPAEVAKQIARATHAFVARQYRCWNNDLKPALAGNGIYIRGLSELDDAGREFVEQYCERELDPLLTPVTIDPAHPFPRVINKALCLALMLRRRRRSSPTYLGVVTVPRALPRLVMVRHSEGNGQTIEYVALADLVGYHAARMYRGFDIVSEAAFRITRNSNLYLQEKGSSSLLESVRSQLRSRHKGDAVRLEIEADARPEMTESLRAKFVLDEWQVFRNPGPVSLSQLMHIYDRTDRADLKFKPFVARELVLSRQSANIFDEIDRRDILIHSPFDSFDSSVVDFLETAADDPDVLSIKQTLYRTGDESPIIDALVRAARSKEVTAVVELKARFDEAANIRWARYLEDAGVQVFYGLVDLKTHCKLALVVRRQENARQRRYVHLSTGNYNPATARAYTDLSLFTANEDFTGAAHSLFNFLTAYAEHSSYEPLLVAPQDLAENTLALIAREARHALGGRPSRIIFKVNGLLDTSVIQELYHASQAGVQIDLIVRGMCALRPGIPGISGNIRVRSIVGRLLEHSRILYFENGGTPVVFLGSADLMPRNLYDRVEVVFPVRDTALCERIRYEILDAYLSDVAKARLLRRDGSYQKASASRRKACASFEAQQFLIDMAAGKATADKIPRCDPQKRRRTKPARREYTAA